MRRRFLLGLPLVAPALLCRPSLAAPRPAGLVAGLAIVMNSGDASLSVLDVSTGAELRRIPVLREPHHMALSPDGRSLLVGDSAGNEMLFLNPATGAIENRMPLADPYQLGFSPDGKWLTVTGLARNQVDVYEAQGMTLAHRFPARTMPSHLAYAPDSSVVYITLQGTNQVAAFDLHSMTKLWEAPSGKTPAGILWHDGRLLVADMGTDYFVVMDPTDGHVLRRVIAGRGCHQIFPSPDGTTLWVNNRVDGTTMDFDAKTLALRRTYKIGGGPDCIEFAADGKLWITRRFAKTVAVLDPASGSIVDYPVGRSPHGIFLTAAVRAKEGRAK